MASEMAAPTYKIAYINATPNKIYALRSIKLAINANIIKITDPPRNQNLDIINLHVKLARVRCPIIAEEGWDVKCWGTC